MASSRMSRWSSSSSNRPSKPFGGVGRPPPPRQALITEGDGGEDEAPGEEELVPADGDAANPSLEEVLQAEAEILATELEEWRRTLK